MGGSIIQCSHSSSKHVNTPFRNSFVGACVLAYNEHYVLQLSPDDVWIAIMSALSRYINANGDWLRPLFVDHEDQMQLTAVGGGTLQTANYDDLITQLVGKIDANTRSSVRSWAECAFSTTSNLRLLVSKVVLMGAMKHFFTYRMELRCGLPQVCVLSLSPSLSLLFVFVVYPHMDLMRCWCCRSRLRAR